VIETLLQQYSRETGVPLDVADVAALVKFAELVAKWNRIFNLVASSSPNELVTNHIVDCLAAAPFLDGTHIVDVGAGAGFPGIVVAIMRRQSMVTLVESSERKSRFLRQVAIELSLANVDVVCERIENWRPIQPIDDIVCRGYGSLRKFYDDTRALHGAGCRLVAMKGAPSDAEINELELGANAVSVEALEVPGWDHRHLVIINCTG
jgi:16S rRNA (guanine527-N7)-methyltransferase